MVYFLLFLVYLFYAEKIKNAIASSLIERILVFQDFC